MDNSNQKPDGEFNFSAKTKDSSALLMDQHQESYLIKCLVCSDSFDSTKNSRFTNVSRLWKMFQTPILAIIHLIPHFHLFFMTLFTKLDRFLNVKSAKVFLPINSTLKIMLRLITRKTLKIKLEIKKQFLLIKNFMNVMIAKNSLSKKGIYLVT